MKTLWFKQEYVAQILRGDKIDTIRPTSNKLQSGDVVRFSVGPRPAFATARILRRERLSMSAIDRRRQIKLSQIYRDKRGAFIRLVFQLMT